MPVRPEIQKIIGDKLVTERQQTKWKTDRMRVPNFQQIWQKIKQWPLVR
jgi:hypothetical protein